MTPPRPSVTLALLVVCATLAGPARAAEDEPPPAGFQLYEAATQGDTAAVASLLADSPGLARLKFKSDVTALHGAALADEPRTVELLVRRGAFVDARGGQRKVTPLFLAVLQGHARVAEALLAHRADPNAKGSMPGEDGAEEVRPLHLAALNGRADLADLLIRRGAILEPRSSTGETPADYARRGGSPAVSMVLETYRSMGLVRGRPVVEFIRAIEDSDSVAVERAVARQPKLVNSALPGGWTPLHLAASVGSRAVCDALLAHHADATAKDSSTGWTPAMRAFDAGHPALCEYLRQHETR